MVDFRGSIEMGVKGGERSVFSGIPRATYTDSIHNKSTTRRWLNKGEYEGGNYPAGKNIISREPPRDWWVMHPGNRAHPLVL